MERRKDELPSDNRGKFHMFSNPKIPYILYSSNYVLTSMDYASLHPIKAVTGVQSTQCIVD